MQKILNKNHQQGEVVNTQGLVEVHNSLSTQDRKDATKFDNCLMEKLVGKENLKRALGRIERNKGSHGIDKVETKDLRNYLKRNWETTKSQLLQGIYKPSPVRRVEIPKPDGGTRELGIPTVLDRFIQQAILQILTPIFDPTFSNHSYGFREGRKAWDAVKEAQSYIKAGYIYEVDIDIEKFFDRVNHDKLMYLVSRKVTDKRLLKIIRAYLNAGIMINGCCVNRQIGTPQGSPLSPLLANIMLHELDKELEKRGHKFCRYADDCNIYVKSLRAGERVYSSIKVFLEKRLKLRVNEKKSSVGRPCTSKFLGFSFTKEKETRIGISAQSIERFKNKIRILTSRTYSISLQDRIKKLNEYLRGWFGYYRLMQTPSIMRELDGWIRRRLRMDQVKAWKNPGTIKRNLIALGIKERDALNVSYRKGYWKLASIPPVQKALSLKYWKQQGLFSLVDNYQMEIL
jgi:group II intron reverse transcriptase/maturase